MATYILGCGCELSCTQDVPETVEEARTRNPILDRCSRHRNIGWRYGQWGSREGFRWCGRSRRPGSRRPAKRKSR